MRQTSRHFRKKKNTRRSQELNPRGFFFISFSVEKEKGKTDKQKTEPQEIKEVNSSFGRDICCRL